MNVERKRIKKKTFTITLVAGVGLRKCTPPKRRKVKGRGHAYAREI